jgi:F-type H+-transporting ATPase subunit gamma
MSLKEVKGKIRAVKKIHQVTKAMEAVSAVKMRRSQATAIEARPFALHAIGLLRRLVRKGEVKEHVLVSPREKVQTALIVVITSDRGLAGSLNGYVLKMVHKLIAKEGWTREQVAILAIGKKGYEHFEKRGFRIVDHLDHWGENVAIGNPDELARTIIADYAAYTYDKVMVVYSNFESTFIQQPVAHQLLPVSFETLEEVIEGIVPERGKYSELRDAARKEVVNEYIFEPGPKAVFDALLPYLIGVVLYHAVLEANASEHSARMVAMKSASDRSRDIAQELTLAYNKARQSSITAEVSEITSGIEAMR